MKYALISLLFTLLVALPGRGQSLDALIASAERKIEHDDWVRAVSDLESIISRYKSSLSPIQTANVYNDLGYLNMRLLDAEQAEYYLNLSLITHEEAGTPNKLDYASALQNMSQFFLQRVQFDLAKNYIDQAIRVIVEEKGKDNAEYALARTKLAQVYEEVGYYDLAYEIFFDSHESLKKLGAFTPDYAEACNHMGRILIRRGEPGKAEEFFNESTVIYQQLGSDYDVERAESLEGLGNFYEQLGRYEEAEKILLQALEIKRSIPNEANILIIETLNDLGILYRHLGDAESAEAMFLEVVKECEEELTTDHPFYATAKNNIATIAMQKEEFDKAKQYLKEALTTLDNKYGPNHPLSANTLNNLARVEKQLGNDELAEEYYKRVLTLDERLYGRMHPDYATTLMNLAILYSASGEDDKAENYYKEALSIRKEVLGVNHPAYYLALENVGLHAMAVNKMEDAERYFREAIEIQIGQIKTVFPALSVNDQELFYNRVRDDVDRYNFIALSLLDKNPEVVKNIFDYQLKTKSILFSPAEKIKGRIINGNDPQLRSAYFDWLDEKRLLANYYRIGEQQLIENNIRLSSMEDRIADQERSITARMQEFGDIIPDLSDNWQAIQQGIPANEALVEIIKVREFKSQKHGDGIVFGFTDQTQYIAIIFTENSSEPQYAVLGEGFEPDEFQLDRYMRSLANDSGDAFDLNWKPIHSVVGKVSTVRVIPDGIFHKINPNSLSISSGEYLIDKYFVSYLTSSSDILRKSPEALTKRGLLFGNPDFRGSSSTDRLRLPSLMTSELEIKSIAALLEPKDWEAKVYARQDATELRIKSAFNPTILHIATYGYFTDTQAFVNSVSELENPQFKSGLLLSGASNTYASYENGIRSNAMNDGILTTYEALSLDLTRTKLMVLSAPNAGLDNTENREGLYGLQRAFVVAGAQNLITNFTGGNEQAASEMMVLFYHKYMETENAGESLRFAQMKLRTKYNDPRIWGSFMLIGNG